MYSYVIYVHMHLYGCSTCPPLNLHSSNIPSRPLLRLSHPSPSHPRSHALPLLFLLLITWPLRHCLLVAGSDRQSAFWRSSARRPLACKVDSSDLRGKEGVKGAVSRLLEAVTDECSECWQPVCQSNMSSNKKKIQLWAQLSNETDHVLII